MAMSSEDKGGQELAAAWLRRGARHRQADDPRQPRQAPNDGKVIRHPDTNRGFGRV